LSGDRTWIGVGGRPEARELLFGGHRVPTGITCRFPLVCALDPETAALVDARTVRQRPNAWIVGADGRQLADFYVGDAVQSVAGVGGRLVVTHFDEGYGNALHGMLAFDRAGCLQLDYGRDVPGALDIVDCYAIGPVGSHSALLLIYPEFPLAEVDLETRSQRVWDTPDAVHGAGAVSAEGPTAFFHGPYNDRTGVYAWRFGDARAVRVSSFDAPLRGLPGGWFLGRVEGRFARVRFEASKADGSATPTRG
jgi:hypothetical protein